MPTSSNSTRRKAKIPSARPASAASRAPAARARSRASERVVDGADDGDTPPPVFAPAQLRARADGWTPERQVRFVEALAESGCVEEACRSVGLSKQSAYALRMRVDAQGFRMAWEAAMELAIRRLSDECYSRALNGEEVPHYYQGELVGTHRRYDNKLAMFLLRYRDPLRYAATLDQMVYSGHPEGAALAFAKARDRCADEAWGVADQPGEEVPPGPWEKKPLAEMKAAAVEAVERPGDSWAEAVAADRVRAAAERELARTIYAATGEPVPARFASEEPAPKADVPSSSSTSAADPPPVARPARPCEPAAEPSPPRPGAVAVAQGAPPAASALVAPPLPALPPEAPPTTTPADHRRPAWRAPPWATPFP